MLKKHHTNIHLVFELYFADFFIICLFNKPTTELKILQEYVAYSEVDSRMFSHLAALFQLVCKFMKMDCNQMRSKTSGPRFAKDVRSMPVSDLTLE